jgi:hypothetical protein
MTAVRLTAFQGMIPSLGVRALAEGQASYAVNVDVTGASLLGLPSPTLHKSVASWMRRAFRVPTGDVSNWALSYWMAFSDADTDVQRTPVVDDSFERIYWCGRTTTGLRVLSKAVIVAASETTDWSTTNLAQLSGITRPSNSLQVQYIAGTGTTGDGAPPEVTRNYVVTFINIYGEESQPSDPVRVVGPVDGDYLLTNIPTPVLDATRATINEKRIYRTVTAANGTATFYKVADINSGVVTYTDNTGTIATDAVITAQGELESTNYDGPPAGLQGIAMMANGIMVGWVDNNIHFSEPYRPHAWPAVYTLTTEYPVVGIGVFGNSAVILTTGHPAVVTGINPSNMVLTPSKVPAPCLSKASIVSTPSGVVFASDNGLMHYGPAGLQNITDKIIGRNTWGTEFYPRSIRAVELDGTYQAVYPGTVAGFYFRPMSQEQGVCWLDTGLGNLYDIRSDAWTGRPYIIASGNIYEWLPPSTTTATYVWRSKEFQLQVPVNMKVAQIFFPMPGSVMLRVWAYLRGYDGTVTKTLVMAREFTVSGEEVKLPAGFMADVWQFELEGTAEVHALCLATSVAELRNV